MYYCTPYPSILTKETYVSLYSIPINTYYRDLCIIVLHTHQYLLKRPMYHCTPYPSILTIETYVSLYSIPINTYYRDLCIIVLHTHQYCTPYPSILTIETYVLLYSKPPFALHEWMAGYKCFI